MPLDFERQQYCAKLELLQADDGKRGGYSTSILAPSSFDQIFKPACFTVSFVQAISAKTAKEENYMRVFIEGMIED